MRNQTLKCKQVLAIKNIVSSKELADTCIELDEQSLHTDIDINISHHSHVDEREDLVSKQKINPFDTFMRSLPKYRKNIKRPIIKSLPKQQPHFESDLLDGTSFYKTNSCSQKLNSDISQLEKNVHKGFTEGPIKNTNKKEKIINSKLEALKERSEKNVRLNYQHLKYPDPKSEDKQHSKYKSCLSRGPNQKNQNKSIFYNFVRNGKLKQLVDFRLEPTGIIHDKCFTKVDLKAKSLRKNIYHSLKQKSEVNKKTKHKNFQSSKTNKEDLQQHKIHSGFNYTLRLHYATCRQTFKNIQFRSAKHYSLPYEPEQQLRVSPQQAKISPVNHNDVHSPFGRKTCLSNIKTKSRNQLPDLICPHQNFEEKNTKIKYVDNGRLGNKPWTETRFREVIKQKPDRECVNLFRELTPWHSQQVE